MTKYYLSLRKPKRTEWDFLKMANILNTSTIYYNLAEQYWGNVVATTC